MSDAVYVELAVDSPGGCPIALASESADAPVTDLSRTAIAGADTVTEEFTLGRDASPDVDEVAEVARYDSHSVYRFTRSGGDDCVCELVERLAGPVSDIRAREGALYVSFHQTDLEAVREVVGNLKEAFDGVRVRQLRHSDDRVESDPVLVDRARLTERQRDVLRTAYEMGYFSYPKGANAGEVASALDISPSTFSEHLAAAQTKITETVVEA